MSSIHQFPPILLPKAISRKFYLLDQNTLLDCENPNEIGILMILYLLYEKIFYRLKTLPKTSLLPSYH